MATKPNILQLNNIFFDAVNRENFSDEILLRIPHFDYLDIIVVFYYDVEKRQLITYNDLKKLRLSKNQLFKIAKTNMQIKYPVRLSSRVAKDGSVLFYEMTNSLGNPLSCLFYDNSKKLMKDMGEVTYFSDFTRKKITFFTECLYENKDELAQLIETIQFAGLLSGEYTKTPSIVYRYDTVQNKLTHAKTEFNVLDEEKDFLEY